MSSLTSCHRAEDRCRNSGATLLTFAACAVVAALPAACRSRTEIPAAAEAGVGAGTSSVEGHTLPEVVVRSTGQAKLRPQVTAPRPPRRPSCSDSSELQVGFDLLLAPPYRMAAAFPGELLRDGTPRVGTEPAWITDAESDRALAVQSTLKRLACKEILLGELDALGEVLGLRSSTHVAGSVADAEGNLRFMKLSFRTPQTCSNFYRYDSSVIAALSRVRHFERLGEDWNRLNQARFSPSASDTPALARPYDDPSAWEAVLMTLQRFVAAGRRPGAELFVRHRYGCW